MALIVVLDDDRDREGHEITGGRDRSLADVDFPVVVLGLQASTLGVSIMCPRC